ncbi:MAG: rod shape-determining protein MreD [Clostridia bacterium]|nr:rod shape-determining protein MreD [Clostridia bacterium]MBR2328066.1 rod shape-determining protein MreD [Clostridia bacterium]
MKLIEKITGKRIVIYLLLIISLFLETATARFSLFGAEPCFVYPCLLTACFYLGEKETAILGLIFGILLDFETSFIGYNAIFFAVTLYGISIMLRTFLNRNVLTFSATSLATNALYILLAFIFYLCIGKKIPFFTGFAVLVLPKLILSFAVAEINYFICYFVRDRFTKFWGINK